MLKRPDEMYGPLSRLYVIGAVPPEPVAVILPVFSPLQVTSVFVTVAVRTGGCVIVNPVLYVQDRTSRIVTLWLPGARPVNVPDVW